ncbi:amidohydrolase family protein [Sphingorhabdus sp. Alg239-R122]|uniref:amidohydrolase family protein n=1 Tax=Sphingorhabdus sp. Alg239-R122 TaxID=2305989 RepID=UPI0013DCA628|nr:amidohydrolase family protein [Sphingorhabdus sp. Alg239-R122]
MKKYLLFALALIAAPAAAETVAITGGKVVIGDGSAPVEGGTVVLRDGKVVAAGSDVSIPADARRVDATGRWVTPGIFAGFSRVGLSEIGAVSQTNDISGGSSAYNASIDVVPAINPKASAIAVNRTAGVTRAVVAPSTGRNIFAGFGAVIDLGQDYDAITKARAFQFVEFGESGAAEAGGSRSALYAEFRSMLAEAARYARGPVSYDSDILTRSDARALQDVINGRVRLVVHVERASDILQLIKLGREYPRIKLVMVGVSEGWLVADKIAASGIPVIASALNDLPESFESIAATQSNIGRMKRAGVNIAIGMINDWDQTQLRYSAQYAGNLVAIGKIPGASGLSWDEAFAAITSGPAKTLGIDGRIGSLRPGRAGDVVIWDGDPLELSSAPVMVMIDGVQQSLDNRQARLRERYRTPEEDTLPKAYER